MKFISSKVLAGCVAAGLSIIFSSTLTGGEKEVFRAGLQDAGGSKSGFDEGVVMKIEPDGRKPVRLNLRDLPPHQFLRIEAMVEIPMTDTMGFAMMMGGGVDQDLEKIPRSRLQITVDGKVKALDASFGGAMGTGGSFPDFDDQFLHVPGTGSEHGPLEVEVGAGPEIMFGAFEELFGDADKLKKLTLHKISVVIPHTDKNAVIELNWKSAAEMAIAGGGGVGVEIPFIMGGADPFGFGGGAPYSVRGITASVIDEPLELDQAEFESRYQKLAGEPVAANHALNDLVEAGDAVLPMLRSKLTQAEDPDLEKKMQEALSDMDDPSFQKRTVAAKTIRSFGKKAVPFAKKVLAEKGDELSVETKRTLEEISQHLETGSFAVLSNSRANRLHRLFDLVGSEDAQALKSLLPKSKMVVSPDVAGTLDKLMEQMSGAGIEFGFPPDVAIDPFGPGDAPGPGGDADPFAP